MRLNAYSTTKDMMKFILASDDFDDTVCDHNIIKSCNVDSTTKAIYKMKNTDGDKKINLSRNAHMYTAD